MYKQCGSAASKQYVRDNISFDIDGFVQSKSWWLSDTTIYNVRSWMGEVRIGTRLVKQPYGVPKIKYYSDLFELNGDKVLLTNNHNEAIKWVANNVRQHEVVGFDMEFYDDTATSIQLSCQFGGLVYYGKTVVKK